MVVYVPLYHMPLSGVSHVFALGTEMSCCWSALFLRTPSNIFAEGIAAISAPRLLFSATLHRDLPIVIVS